MKKYNVAEISWLELFGNFLGEKVARKVVDLIKKEILPEQRLLSPEATEFVKREARLLAKNSKLGQSQQTFGERMQESIGKPIAKEQTKPKYRKPKDWLPNDRQLCKRKGCEYPVYATELCKNHYQQQRYRKLHSIIPGARPDDL